MMLRDLFLAFLMLSATAASAAAPRTFQLMDVFDLQWAADPQVAPDGRRVAYVRMRGDVMKDAFTGDLWLVGTDGSGHEPLASGAASPRWSPDGTRLAYVAGERGKAQIFVRWMESGATTQVTRVVEKPSALTWSPDGHTLAFTMPVASKAESFVKPLPKPAGAEWAAPPRFIESLVYREDGEGYLPDARQQVFVVSADGGAPRQLTDGPYDHEGPLAWTPDGRQLLVSANRQPDGDYDPANSEIHSIRVSDGSLTTLTSRKGPDQWPVVSPDGRWIAYLGYDDRYQGYQNTLLSVLATHGGGAPRIVSAGLDRSVEQPVWAPGNREIVVSY